MKVGEIWRMKKHEIVRATNELKTAGIDATHDEFRSEIIKLVDDDVHLLNLSRGYIGITNRIDFVRRWERER